MSDQGTIIHLDNEEAILKQFKSLYDQSDIDLNLVSCQTIKEFEEKVQEKSGQLRGLIFDLLSSEPGKEELHEKDAEFLETIENSFAQINIPIFIYSGYLEAVNDKFDQHGTVFKIDKGAGPDEIIRLIKLFKDSGFLEVFSPGGKIEVELHKDLNKAFVTQFSNNSQIEEIINIISHNSEGEEFISRVEKVFKRMALGALFSDLRSPELGEDGKLNMDFANPVEHYIQRISAFEFWTGDIFKNNEEEEYLIILTPRCNVASKKHDELLVCKVNINSFPKDTSNRGKRDEISAALRDNAKFSGYNRFIPPSPLFPSGGEVDFSTFSMVSKEMLSNDYHRLLSLSDELTNEILGKFGAYFFRTGITPWHEKEVFTHLNEESSE